jgi:outer membrane lipase/esterase
MQPLQRFLRVAAVLLAICGAGLAARANAAPDYPAMFVFGDSLSDIGNDLILTQRLGFSPAIPPSASPYATDYRGRFSNGYVAVEYLWWLISGHAPETGKALKPALSVTRLGAGQSLNFAFGGAGTAIITRTPSGFSVPGLLGQVATFAGLRPLVNVAKPALYVVAAGSNDYLFQNPAAPADPAVVVGRIVTAINRLHASGARNFVVWNVPDLGRLPLTAASQDLSGLLSQQSQAHNALLAQSLATLSSQLAGVRIVLADLNEAGQLVPGTELFAPALDAIAPPQPGQVPASSCLFVDPRDCTDVPTFQADARYFYWDVEHPATATHKLLGQYLYQKLSAQQ